MFSILPSIAISQNLWELEKDSDGIKVFTRLETGSPYKSFKAITVTDASSEVVAEKLQDIDGYVMWFAFTEKVKLLASNSNEKFVYMETQFPWPFKNEDMIYRITFATEGNGITKVTLTGVPDYLPPVEGINRMKDANGYILLKTIGNKTEVTYFMHSDLGGDIPLWMANKFIWNLPFKTLRKLNTITSISPSTEASITQVIE